MKHFLITFFFLISVFGFSQDTRLIQLEAKLSQRSAAIKGLQETVELDLTDTDVFTLLTAVAKVHELNMVIAPELKNQRIENTFNEVQVQDLLMYFAKEYSLDYEFVGNIITVKKYNPPPPQVASTDRTEVNYDLSRDYISLDLNNANLADVFRVITNQTGKNLLYDNSLSNQSLSIFIKDVPLIKGMEQLALGNNLLFEVSKDGFYLFSNAPSRIDGSSTSRVAQRRGRSFEYTVLDTLKQQLKVNFQNAPVEDVVLSIAGDLDLGIFIASPLSNAGTANIKSKSISFEELLDKIFEGQQSSTLGTSVANTNNPRQNNRPNNASDSGSSADPYIFKREGNLFFFGTSSQLSLRNIELIPLKYRSIEIIQDQEIQMNNSFSTNQVFAGSLGTGFNGFSGNNIGVNRGVNNQNSFNNQASINNRNGVATVISELMPDDVVENLNIKIDRELNSFIVSGTADRVKKFKELINAIDKPVPVILIETMIIEINRTSTVETGIEWGLGDAPTATTGNIFPSTDIRVGANTVNRVLGGLEGFTSLNLGRVVPNFFANLKAMETNGDISIQSSPKLSVLNGHQANLSIGQTTYYVITSRDIIGAQNPQTQIVENFQPIDAELGIFIKPIVSQEGEITMGIVVNQSTFTGVRISENAPPDITSRQFTSTVRVQDKDIIILGGLEDVLKSNTGTGVPFLARVPVIKWLFSKRVREGSKKKLAILIRPTVLN